MPDPTAESAAREPDALADTQVDGRSDASEPSGLRELLRAKAHEWKLRATRKFDGLDVMLVRRIMRLFFATTVEEP